MPGAFVGVYMYVCERLGWVGCMDGRVVLGWGGVANKESIESTKAPPPKTKEGKKEDKKKRTADAGHYAGADRVEGVAVGAGGQGGQPREIFHRVAVPVVGFVVVWVGGVGGG